MSYAVPPTRTAAVVRQLRNEIVTGELPPGTLIKDAELASRLGVSITPVREAIAQLSVEGLIDIAPNRTRHVTRVTQKNALELIDVMSVLACAGFEWGVDNLTETHIDLMRQRQKEFVEALRAGNVLAASANNPNPSALEACTRSSVSPPWGSQRASAAPITNAPTESCVSTSMITSGQ